eukprot:TRINITY_DN2402_c0_g1_i1.p1 TRINITY_DN2402_c0_g1~~TRINITY_DN2402_c0_g1_i1.p1  ORF type:complete len:203 (-),score=60.20 TRINITY_DN2402_c0_g1_i1:45-596(-)
MSLSVGEDLEDNVSYREKGHGGKKGSSKKTTAIGGPKPQKGEQEVKLTTAEFTQPGDPTYGHLRSYFHQSKESSPLIGGFYTKFHKIMKGLGLRVEFTTSTDTYYYNVELQLPQNDSANGNNNKTKSNKAKKKEEEQSTNNGLPYLVINQASHVGEKVFYRQRRIRHEEDLDVEKSVFTTLSM